MRLIILHGAPAAGKFTVGQELEKATGYKLVHIHSLYDFIEGIFGKERYETSLGVLNRASLDIFEQAARSGLPGLIYTYAELARSDFQFPKEILARLAGLDVKIHLVHLSCDTAELHRRIANSSRRQFAKTTSSEELDQLLTQKDYASTFPRLATLEIDTSKLSAPESAELIARHYSLDRRG
jgi:shikimate kinase